MPSEEVVDRDIPLSREFKPVCAIPPVRVEVSVREAGDFSESTENVFEDYKEDQEECYHKGEKQLTN